MNDLEALSDADLDRLYYNARNAKQFVIAANAAAVIVDRLTTPGAFLGGLFGSQKFPLYESVSGFSQVDAARESTANSGKHLANTAGHAVSNLAGGIGTTLFKATWPLLIFAGIVAAIYFGGKK
jgi:hypothetical protein